MDALISEIRLYQELLSNKGVSSLYFGGGTPSLLEEKELAYLLEGVFGLLEPSGEISFEMNPEDVSESKLKLLGSYGNFRISLGAQSFDEEVLKLFGRSHGVEEIYRGVDLLNKLGFDNYSLDLIYAVSQEFSLDSSIKAVKDILPSHLSCYALELHPSRPLAKLIEEPGEELFLRDWGQLKEALSDLGYQRYEISSFARDGKFGFHNINYWQGGEYLGLGLGAHGYLHPNRYVNERNLRAYMTRVTGRQRPVASFDVISHEEKRFEKFMLGLRLVEGIDLRELYPLSEKEKRGIEKHCAGGLLVRQADRLSLSQRGFDLINHVLVDFL